MSEYLDDLDSYWDKRFEDEKKIWGDSPSKTAYLALDCFGRYQVRKILVPGSGYGRHTRLFSSRGYDVCGVEISEKACSIALKNDPETEITNGSYLDFVFPDESFDAVYCFNVLHLLREKERMRFIDKCRRELKTDGICFFVVFSEQEKSFGKGREVEKNTFESKPDRPVHYFSREDLESHFKHFDVIEEDLIDDPENHGETGEHTHRLRYIICRKGT